MKQIWNFDNIPPQTGRIAVVTGANSGLGYATALMLARRGAEVIMGCRSRANAERAMAEMRREHPAEYLQLTFVAPLDLSNLDSVEAFASEVAARYSKVDLLINNAGVMYHPFTRTAQGFELTFGVNHLGHFALTGRLLPLIADVKGARIVTLSSIGAYQGNLTRLFEDPNYEHRKYRKGEDYGTSKLANQMFAFELARRLKYSGAKAMAMAAHPGITKTELFKHSWLERATILNLGQLPEMGALPALRAATDSEAENGSYWGPSGFMEIKGWPTKASVPSAALSADSCRLLWTLSEQMTGVKIL